MNSGAVFATGLPGRDPADVLTLRREPGAGESGSCLLPTQRARDVECGRPRRATERDVEERGLDRREAALVVTREVEAQVVVVDRGRLEVRQTHGVQESVTGLAVSARSTLAPNSR